ncbi:DUF4381 domain-containing protein [Parahaliea mediterranea]|uniref:DUF4381 domain-containing protein n=1 Tax=Parahaliea mediterranea TaxID=651086 RepID=A0A939IN87_9GAMM|nr:DUF4381 domain-containing protein [Parahaliea mediterranea]MBN7797853.1 DUF4381 domain-containing protein [Parahaliea mediterranea]
MSAPALPESFGNYALGETFTEVLPPAGIAWWPQTAGWAALGAVLGLYLLYRAGRALRRWHRNRYRREARAELQNLAATAGGEQFAAALSELLKRTALAAFPRREVAPLHGEPWVAFLNTHCATAPFDGEAAALIARGQYLGAPLGEPQRRALVHACQLWILTHRGPADA